MLQSRRHAEHLIEPGIQRGDAVAQVGHQVAVAAGRLIALKKIVVDIGCDHDELVDQADQLRIVELFRRGDERLLHDVVAHAVREHRHFHAAELRRIVGARGDALTQGEIVVQFDQQSGEIGRTRARVFAVGEVAGDVAFRRPRIQHELAEFGAFDQTAFDREIVFDRVLPTRVVTVHEQTQMFLLLVLGLGHDRALGADLFQLRDERLPRHLCPRREAGELGRIRIGGCGVEAQGRKTRAQLVAVAIAVADHQIGMHAHHLEGSVFGSADYALSQRAER